MNFLQNMCVLVTMGGIYVIPTYDEEVSLEQAAEQRPRGRRNVRAQGK